MIISILINKVDLCSIAPLSAFIRTNRQTKPINNLTGRAHHALVWNVECFTLLLRFTLGFYLFCLFFFSFSASDNPSLLSHVPVTVQVLDVNDNPPEIATDEEVIVCESSRPGQVSVRDSPRKTQKHLFPFFGFFPSTSLTSNIRTFLQVKNTSEVKCWALSIKHSHFPGYMNSAPNCCFPQQFGLLTESWAIRDCEGTGESCLIIPHSKWVSQQQTMTALNRSSFQFALSSLWFIQIKKVFEIQRDQQHGKWLKGWFGKGWWSKD